MLTGRLLGSCVMVSKFITVINGCYGLGSPINWWYWLIVFMCNGGVVAILQYSFLINKCSVTLFAGYHVCL